MELQELATRLGLALALGFVIGLERGWKERDEGEGQRAREDAADRGCVQENSSGGRGLGSAGGRHGP